VVAFLVNCCFLLLNCLIPIGSLVFAQSHWREENPPFQQIQGLVCIGPYDEKQLGTQGKPRNAVAWLLLDWSFSTSSFDTL